MTFHEERSDGMVGVVLFQLGGPDSPEAVEPFLFNLFSDPDIIDFPFARLARPALARLVASRRAEKVREHYASLGGKSPIGELTERQARALERALARELRVRVFVAMRYWHPLTEEAVRQVETHGCRELVLLPLYPQYSCTTTGSSLNEWARRYPGDGGRATEVKTIRQFYDHPTYLEALVEKVNEGLGRFGREASDVWLVFSAHGVPTRVIEAGDPYRAQIEASCRLVVERGGWSNPHRLCYQSRVGPGRWLSPSLVEALQDLAAQGARRVLVVPVSFVCDHIETLGEINMEARQRAVELGIDHFELMPALNDSPTFIRALAELVLGAVATG